MLLLVSMLTVAGSASAQDEVTLTIWTFGAFFTDLYKGIEADYKEIAPHVTIEVEEIPYVQLYDNLQGAFVAGVGAPDIVDVEQGVISRFLKGEPGLVPLNDMIAPYEDDYIMAKTALYAHQGAIYGIDHCLCPVVLYYRHDIFADAGLEFTERANIRTGLMYCDVLRLLRAATPHMTEVSAQGVTDALWTLGGSFEAASVYGVEFTEGSYAGGDLYRRFRFDSDCECMALTGDPVDFDG